MENSSNLTPFEGEKIRKLWHDEQWYFSVVDIIGILTDSEKLILPTAPILCRYPQRRRYLY